MVPTPSSLPREEWLLAVRAKIPTYVGYEGHVRRYVVPQLGEKQLDELTRAELNGLYASC